ncbi:MAG: hypothetical protein WCT11_04155 [Candidatus Magasanikbacteria bacterium]|jgi:hypothetical protein
MPQIPTLDIEEKELSKSVEDLREDEFEENLDEYGDGNQETAWPDKGSKADEEDDEEI